MDTNPKDPQHHLGDRLAIALVFGASAAVLVIEIVALRLLVPYFGLTLETSTFVIAIALAAIAAGSWAGGWLADRVEPRRLLAPLLAISGLVTASMPVAVRAAAELGSGGLLWLVAAVCIMIPGALLSAVTPAVIKLRLTSLNETGSTVGRLSGIGTIGSIVGTVVTGFVLISRIPVSMILLSLGAALIMVSVGLQWRTGNWLKTSALLPVVALVGVGTSIAPGGCDRETAYHCLVLESDPERDSGVLLILDGIRHSYVDASDPTHLEFSYARASAAVIETTFSSGQRLDAYHLGGGGLTIPRYLTSQRPGTENIVSEIDRGVAAFDSRVLGLDEPHTEVRIEDGRLGLGRLADSSQDLVVGDAFGGVSVPWHLTTQETLADIDRVLRPGGLYVMNTIDHGPLDFVRAEIRTMATVFRHVVLLAPTEVIEGTGGGNLVLVGSDQPVDVVAVEAAMTRQDLTWGSLTDAAVIEWAGEAVILTDDYAPVDQLLTPYPVAMGEDRG